MKQIKTSLYLMLLLFTINLSAQWVITPSTPVTSYSAPNWATDTDLNDNYTVMTYGTGSAPLSTTYMRIFNNANNPITSDINLNFTAVASTTKVKISQNNDIYVLGSGSSYQLQLKKYNTSGNLISTVNIGTTTTNFNLSLADNNDVLVSYFTTEGNTTASDVRVNSYNSNLGYKGTITVATGIINFSNPSGNIKAHFLDFNNGSFVVGYSRGYDSSLTSTIKKYQYNTSSINSSVLQNTYNFTGGFKRTSFGISNLKQIALRDNGDIFYVNGINGVNRISSGVTTVINSNINAKVNIDASNSLLLSWVDSSSIKARLYNQSNQFIHYYQEDGNINGAWSVAFNNCKFSIIGDKSNLGSDYHTNRKPHYQFFNCSACTAGGPPTASASFRYPYAVEQVPSLYGPLDVTELCLVDDLLVDGSASCNESGYFVELAEFNPATWTDIQVLHSNWILPLTQAPNNINIVSFLPNGYHLRPGKIYRFRLAVGNPWHSVDIFFKVSCCQRRIIVEDPVELDPVKGKTTGNEIETIENIEKVTIFPNPAQEKITINLEQLLNTEKEATIKIYNNLGHEIFNKSTNDKELIIESSKWNKGYYICKIFTSNETITKKIIKE